MTCNKIWNRRWLRCSGILLAVGALSQSQTTAPSAEEIIADLQAGRYSAAREMIDSALKTLPNDKRLWTLQGFALVRLGDEKGALGSYQHALHLSPDYLPALEGAAEIEYKASDQQAVPLLKRVLEIRPSDPTTHAMLGALAFKRHDCISAAQEFQMSRSYIDSQTAALAQYGSCLVKLRRVSDAIPVFARISEAAPSDGKARYNLAVVQSLDGKYQDVIHTLTKTDAESSLDLDSLDLLAEAYEATSDTPHAVQNLREAILRKPDVPRFYVQFANLCFAHSSFQVGVDMINAGLKRMPQTASLYLARGILYVQLGKYDEAEKDFSEAERLDPSIEFGSSAQGLAQLQRDDLDRAEATTRNRLKVKPDDAFLHYLLAEILVRRGAEAGSARFQEAMAQGEKALMLQPNLAFTRDVLGRLLLQSGRTKEAIEQSRLALKQDPTDQTALYHLMVALRKNNETSELPALAKRLAELRDQARNKEAAEHKYALVEPESENQSRPK